MHFFFLSLLVWITLCYAEDPTETVSPTLVWVTGTDAAGNLATTQSKYQQEFSTLYGSVPPVPSGQIGMGSLSGVVGEKRTYSTVTISNDAGSGSAGTLLTGLALMGSFMAIF